MVSKVGAPSVLSATSRLALQAERQEGIKKSVFWDKWSKLSTGHKIGRALSWLLPPLGAGLQAGASFWQQRQAKLTAVRPLNDQIRKSPQLTHGVPVRMNAALGRDQRVLLTSKLRNDPDMKLRVKETDNFDRSYVGLGPLFAKDVPPSDPIRLQSGVDNSIATLDKNTQAPGDAFRRFFQNEFPGDPGLAEQWSVAASKFLNQTPVVRAQALSENLSESRLTFSDEARFNYSLKMEPGGSSAVIEGRIVGPLEKIYDTTTGRVLDLTDPANGIDPKRSQGELSILLRVNLTPPEERLLVAGDAPGEIAEASAEQIEVLSCTSKYSLARARQRDQAQVDGEAPLDSVGVVDEEPVNADQAVSLLRLDAQGLITDGSDGRRNLDRFLSQFKDINTPPDFSPFKKAYQELDGGDEKGRLVRTLSLAIAAHDAARKQSAIDQALEDPDLERSEETLRSIREDEPALRLARAYPLASDNTLLSDGLEKRDFDIQGFAMLKLEEEAAREHLGIGAEEFLSAVKATYPEGDKALAVMGERYYSDSRLSPEGQNLRSALKGAFDRASTLDAFYKEAESLVESSRSQVAST